MKHLTICDNLVSNAYRKEYAQLMQDENAVSRFNEIFDSTKKDVLAFITAKCGSTADIDDIFQDTYMELYLVLNKRGAEYVTHEKGLVMRIAKRKIAKYYSLAARLKMFVSMTATNDIGEDVELSEFEAASFLTEDFVVNKILLETVKKYILNKPEEIKKVFYLFYDVGLTIPEIAKSLSISESGVKNKLYRTLKELRNLLKEENHER